MSDGLLFQRDDIKQCKTCKEIKSWREFGKHKRTRDGLNPHCLACRRARQKEKYRTPGFRNCMKQSQMRWLYGIGFEEYDAMLAKQNGLCAICGKEPSLKRRLAIDHCHKTNVVRGLLCLKCNKGIGLLNDDTTTMSKAIEYINRAA